MLRPLCLFHKNCLDGSGSAAVVQRKVPDAEFVPIQYGHPPPVVEGRAVYVVDFGFSLEHMRALKAQASSLVWIDHHASQEDVWRQLGWGIFDINECGTSLTWRTLFPNTEMPPVVSYIRDKDLWQWRLPDSRAICAGLSDAFSQSRFLGLLEADLEQMAARGRPLLDAQRARIVAVARKGTAIRDAFGRSGLRALAVPCTQDQNELGEYICLPESAGGLGYDLAVLFYRKNGTTRWVHSLRAQDAAVDCAGLAANLGGGGHPTSSCFLSDTPIIPMS